MTDQANFVFDLVDFVLSLVGLETKEGSDSECETQLYEKIKMSGREDRTKNINEEYDPNVITSKILLEIVLHLDEFKSVSKRTTT